MFKKLQLQFPYFYDYFLFHLLMPLHLPLFLPDQRSFRNVDISLSDLQTDDSSAVHRRVGLLSRFLMKDPRCFPDTEVPHPTNYVPI